jgi:hypothetical protein
LTFVVAFTKTPVEPSCTNILFRYERKYVTVAVTATGIPLAASALLRRRTLSSVVNGAG